MCMLSCVQLFATLGTATRQASLLMEFFRQENWSGLPFPNPGDFPDPRVKLTSLVSPALTGRFFTTVSPGFVLMSMQLSTIIGAA